MPIPFLNSITLNKNEIQEFKVYNLTPDPTLTSAGDYGYMWLNTSDSPKTLKWWDGTSIRSIVDSGNTSTLTVGTANDLSGGVAGSLPYQQAAGDTTFLGIGTADQVLTVNSGATAPQWLSQSSLSVGSAATATTATTATNVAGGANGSILVQSGAGTTGQLAIGASGYILTSNGTTPGWSASIPSTSVSGLAASATTDTTNASNISSGTLGLARLSLASGQFYVGDGSNNPAATAKSSIPLSGFGAAGADVAMGGFKITGLGTPTASTDAATMGYVDSVAQGLDVKASCLVATTADITLASPGAVTIDGVYSATDFTAGTTRILVKDQSAPAENGIYIWQGPSSAMTRSADANTWDELVGAFTFIERGTANADSGWVCSVNAGGTLGSTAVTWVKFSQAGSYTQGRGMVLDGTAFNFAQNTDYTANTIPYASGATTIGFIGAGTADQVLRVPGAGGTPAFGAIDLTKSAAVTGALPAANGGTGQSSYAVGDILFADSATSLAKLADVATGNALISGGVTTAPSWGKIGLTTHVSGTLPVGNGGTGATSFTQGQVLFAGASTISSSANLFWDNANNRLGINNASPQSSLHVTLPENERLLVQGYFTPGDSKTGLLFGGSQTDRRAAIDVGIMSGGSGYLTFSTSSAASVSALTERLRIGNDGVCTWSNVGGVAGTAMTLNGTGLSIGGSIFSNSKLTLVSAAGVDCMLALQKTGGSNTSVMMTDGTNAWLGSSNGSTGKKLIYSLVAPDNSVVIDGYGNLGLGATASAWYFGFKTIDLEGGVSIYSNRFTPNLNLTSNFYYDGTVTPIYKTNAPASYYSQYNGVHTWGSKAAGTAGQPVNFGGASMTLDASGNLLVGTASTGGKVHVRATDDQVLATGAVTGYTRFKAQIDSGAAVVLGAYQNSFGFIGTSTNHYLEIRTNDTERLRIKSTGQVNFVGQASDPAGAAGDVYYNSTSNRLKYHNGTAWVNTGTNKYSSALAGTGTSFTVTHNLGTRDVTVAVRKSGSTYDQVFTDVQMATDNTVTIVFASSVTGSDYTVTVIG